MNQNNYRHVYFYSYIYIFCHVKFNITERKTILKDEKTP